MQDIFEPDKQMPERKAVRIPQAKSFLPYVNTALIFITMLMVAMAVLRYREPVLETATTDVPLTVVVETLGGRLETMGQTLENLTASVEDLQASVRHIKGQKQTQPVISNATAVITPQMGADLVKSLQPVSLDSNARSRFDAVINGDSDDGRQVMDFLDGLESGQERQAYLDILKSKGDSWMAAATEAARRGDRAGAESACANARYFYGILEAKGSSSLLSAEIAAKSSAYDLALGKLDMADKLSAQQEEMKRQMEDAAEKQQAMLEEERLAREEEKAAAAPKSKETAAEAARRLENVRMKNSGIKAYEGTHPKRYESDWDPDPRVREERGILSENEIDRDAE